MDSEEAQRKFKLAERMYNDGRYGQALLLLDSLDSEFPNAKNVMFPRARCLAKLERTAEALALCDQLIAQFDDPKAKVLKDRLTAGEGDLPPEIAAIPDIGEEVPSAIPRPIAPPQRPFFLSAPFIVGACVVIAFVGIVVAFAVWQRTTQPMEQAEELVVAEEAAPVEPGEDTRVDDIRSVVSSLGWRLLLMLVLFVVEIVAGLYLTLMVVGKLPHESFGADLLSVAPVTIGAWLAGLATSLATCFCPILPCLLSFVPILLIGLILHKVYDMGFLDLLLYFFIVFGFLTADYFLFTKLIAPEIDVLGTVLQREIEESFEEELKQEAGPVPFAEITVDGQAVDWAGINVFLDVPELEYDEAEYDVQTVKLAHNYSYLFVLLELGVSIEQKFRTEYDQTGTVSSGAIGYLNIAAPEYEYSIWLPTGFTQFTDPGTGATTMYPTVSVDVTRRAADGSSSETLMMLDSASTPDSLCFLGKYVEIGFPVDALGFSTDSAVTVTLDE